MCDVFSVIISAKECQTDVRTKIGTILLCNFVFYGISHHRHFIFDFFFYTMYPCPDSLLESVSKQWIKCKFTPNFVQWKTEDCAVGWFIIAMLRKTVLSQSQIGCKGSGEQVLYSSLSTNKLCMTLFWSKTHFFSSTVRPNWVKNVLIVKCFASSVKQNLFLWVSVLTIE